MDGNLGKSGQSKKPKTDSKWSVFRPFKTSFPTEELPSRNARLVSRPPKFDNSNNSSNDKSKYPSMTYENLLSPNLPVQPINIPKSKTQEPSSSQPQTTL